MSDLRELYQEIILDHGRHPRNFGNLPHATCSQTGFNPLCGDKIVLHIFENNGILERLTFEGSGCAISMASASLMTEFMLGKKITSVTSVFDLMHDMFKTGKVSDTENLGKLTILKGVSEFPARVKCATLAWHTLKAAIQKNNIVVNTEEDV